MTFYEYFVARFGITPAEEIQRVREEIWERFRASGRMPAELVAQGPPPPDPIVDNYEAYCAHLQQKAERKEALGANELRAAARIPLPPKC
ncbi:hypothetical protein DFR29_103315 [Tahibacter aquaticus]|uniref:Uncharacterized protein n=1 Tax=Tahibacter aquaticus TaxID=520092 RepID=A0A4R6Z5D4_9GAMM|nr:hypothetical protein [Tahibacter aquaticus]TDR46779.1 hypothetical protein DFR29_103315 [Tahibacter aquaticus]